MKKTLLVFMACLMALGHVQAADVLTVPDVTLPQNGEAVISINCEFETLFKGYQLEVVLDGGLTLVLDEDGKPVGENGFTGTDHSVLSSQVAESHYRFVVVSFDGKLLPTSGTLLKVKVTGAEGMTVGESYEGRIIATEFTTTENGQSNLPDVSFNITIGEPADTRTVLDEASTVAPVAEANANVHVLRTIKAGEWSTICLPFAMSEAQCKEAFGDDVELADFTGCDVDDTTGDIRVNFSDVTAIEANHPYIIKVSEPVTEFFADGVDITPEEEPYIDRDEETTGSGRNKKTTYNSFIGTYVAETVVPDYALFLSDNQFWFSTGNTKMKAFRAYFDLATAGAEYEDEEVAARILMVFNDGGTTGISASLMNSEGMKNDKVYNLKGQRVAQPSKGLYIKDGRKVVVK